MNTLLHKGTRCLVAVACIAAAKICTAESLSSFGYISQKPDAAEAATDARWEPVPADKISLVNAAPLLVPYFNNAPVYGLPGTVTGDLSRRTQLTGDWGGSRTELARDGYFFDLYTTSSWQHINSGGLAEGDSFAQNAQLSFNVDTGRAGWWSGGLLHVTVQARYGDVPEKTLTAGASVPQYTGLVYPAPTVTNRTYPTEYFLVQAFSKEFSIIAGKISNVFIPDQTLMADSYKYYFANFAFNKNPMTPNFYNPTSLALLAAWAPSPAFAVAGGVLDPYSEPNTAGADAFKHSNLYLMTVSTYSLGGLPGQFSPAVNWSNKPKIDLASPFKTLTLPQIPGAVGRLLGLPEEGLPINYQDDSWFAIANFSQYLWLREPAEAVRGKLRSGQVLNGIGLIGRIGYAPERTNPITRDASLALVGHGLLAGRPYDSFGVGFYYNEISDDLKRDIERLTRGTSSVGNEHGLETFYDFALTPAIRLIASYQYIRNPLAARVAVHQDAANVFLARVTLAF